MDKDTLRKLIESVAHAEDEIYHLMCAAEAARGMKGIAKKADTVLGKLENLKWELINKQRK